MRIIVEFDNVETLVAALDHFPNAELVFSVADVAQNTVAETAVDDKQKDNLSLKDFLRRS